MATMRKELSGDFQTVRHRRVIREKVREQLAMEEHKNEHLHQRSESVTFLGPTGDSCTKGQFHVPDKGPSIRETLKLIMAMQMSS